MINESYVDYSIARPIPGYAEAKAEAEAKKNEGKKTDDKKTEKTKPKKKRTYTRRKKAKKGNAAKKGILETVKNT